MRAFRRKMTVLAAMLPILAGGAARSASAADAGAALAAAIMSRLAALPDRQAAFTDQKKLSSLAAPLTSSGMLVFRHPDHLEKLTIAPRPERMIIDRGVLSITEAGGAARTVELDSHPALRALATTITATLAGDLAGLQRLYSVTASGSPASWRMILRPNDHGLGRFIDWVALDGTGDDLRGLQIAQANGDTETMSIQPAR